MLRQSSRIIALVYVLAGFCKASAMAVTVNADAARAVLVALQDTSLSHEEALRIARLPGDKGVIRKLNEFNIPVSTESFADALFTTAHGQKVTDSIETAFYFDRLKQKAQQLLELTKRIEGNPQAFQASIEKRIALFAPPGLKLLVQCYVVAGGDGAGYAFGETDVYLNIGFIDDFILAKSVATHEAYHAVQGAFASARRASYEAPALPQTHEQQTCANTVRLFADLYEEGTAMYVQDISVLPQSHSALAARMSADIADGLGHIHNSAALLELSVLGLSAPVSVPYDDVYEVGFLGHAVLYNIGYVMAKAIAEADGPQGLAAFLSRPSYMFAIRYSKLVKYGTNKEYPKLGPNTMAAANQLAKGCT